MKIEANQKASVYTFPRVMRLKGTANGTPIYAIWYSVSKGRLLISGCLCASHFDDYEDVGSVTITND